MDTKFRVVIADSHALVREALRHILHTQSYLEVIGQAGDGDTAWKRTKKLNPDVLLLDVQLPGLTSWHIVQRLQFSRPHVRIVALVMPGDELIFHQLMTAGAAAILFKTSRSRDLCAAIRTVVRGETYVDPSLLPSVQKALHDPSESPHVEKTLTVREAEVLIEIASGYTNLQIAGRLGVSVKTIEGYKHKMGLKYDLWTRHDMVLYALRRGWLHDK